MNRKLVRETESNQISNYAESILNILEGEKPDSRKSFVLTVSSKGEDAFSLDLFQYDSPDLPDKVAEILTRSTCNEGTEEFYSGDLRQSN